MVLKRCDGYFNFQSGVWKDRLLCYVPVLGETKLVVRWHVIYSLSITG